MDDEHDSDESRGAFAALEAALLAAAARALLRLGSLGPKTVNKGAVFLQRDLAAVESEHRDKIDRAIRRDIQGAMILSALDDLKGAFAEVPKGNAEEAIASAKKAAGTAYGAAIGDTGIFSRNMRRSAVTGYQAAAAKARGRVAVVGYDRAMEEAVTELARQGLTAYTYERKGPNGKQTVKVPVDVGIRRAIHNSGKQHQMEQMLRLAERTGANLVEVSWTGNPRESHHKWEGKIYQLKGSGPYPNFYRVCKVGDKVDGIGGYNCGHKATIYHEGGPRRFSDPLEGTGYTAEEASRLTSQQARLENEVRKEKRVAEVLEANGMDSTEARHRVRMRQKQLRELIAEHPKVLKRRSWRESIYEKARKEAGALGVVHLDKVQVTSLADGIMANMKQPIGIEIDELTPCLRRASDGKIVKTSVKDVEKGSSVLKDGLWEFDWKLQARKSDRVLALFADGDDRGQGLAAIRDTPEVSAVTLDLAESAPWNSKHNKKVEGQEYIGVGGHLFAIAVRESYALGYNGFVAFTAKTRLIDYYASEFGATQILGTANMYIDEIAARRLYERYFRND